MQKRDGLWTDPKSTVYVRWNLRRSATALATKEDFEKTIHLVETTDLLSQMNRAVVANEDHYMGCKRICHLLQQNNGVKNGK